MWAVQQVSRQSVSVWTAVCCSWTSAGERKKSYTNNNYIYSRPRWNKQKRFWWFGLCLLSSRLARSVTAVQSIWATVWNPTLNNYLDVEQRWKNTSLFVWSEVFKFEDGLQDMLADQVGLTSIKCFWGDKHINPDVSLRLWFNPYVCVINIFL